MERRQTTRNQFDAIAYFSVVTIVLVSPWLNAGADLMLRPVLYGLAAIAVGCTYVSVVRSGQKFVVPHVTWLLLLGGFMVGGQLLPSAWFPGAGRELRNELTGSPAGPLSLNPSETRIQLSLLIVCVGMFLACCQLFGDLRRFRLLCYGLMINGAALTVFAIIQRFAGNGDLYWAFELPKNNTTFGPMVYHNVAGAYLCMCLAASGYIITERMKSSLPSSWLESSRAAEGMLAAFVAVGLFCTLSRGALLSAVLSGIVVTYLVTRRVTVPGRMLSGLIALLVCAAGLLFCFGMTDAVTDRLGEMTGENIVNDGRWSHWASAMPAARDFWLFGCGLGAYGDTVAIYKSSRVFFKNAHNQYVETLVSLGVPGILVLLAAIYIIARRYRKALRNASLARLSLVAMVLFVFVSQIAHAFVDYCMFIPAIAMTFAVLIGSSFSRRSIGGTTRHGGLASTAAGGILLLLMIGATWDSTTTARLDYVVRRLPWEKELSLMSVDETTEQIDQLEAALAWRVDEPRALEGLALLYASRYRLLAVDRLSQETSVSRQNPNLWEWTSLEVLHHRIYNLIADSSFQNLDALRQDTLISSNLNPSYDALQRSRAATPLLPTVHLRLEQVAFLGGVDQLDGRHTRHATRTSGLDPGVLFRCGKLAFGAGRFDEAHACWNTSLQGSLQFLSEIRRLALARLDTESFLREVVPANVPALVALLDSSKGRNNDGLDIEQVLREAKALLVRASTKNPDSDELFMASRVAHWGGDLASSVALLKRSVELMPDRVDRRFDLARAYAEVGNHDDAEREAKMCLRIKKTPAIQLFLKQLRAP